MRLHQLEISAFGPFAGTAHVDFDELGSTGLFLLTGATGAGKTSILDAVCFGLYGEVPGDRAGARALRSDHAPPDAEPRVVLTFGVGERIFRFTRTAAWDRPKRRGGGTRRVHASVVAEEQRDGAWRAVSTRLDETGQLVTGLLGMTCGQFTQVVMLPQGRFQAFLRATSAERHAVLQRLFRTQRFDDVERWLAERRRLAGRDLATAQERCTEVLDRLCEAAGTDRPAAWDDHDGQLGPLLDDGSLQRWLDEVEHDLSHSREQRRAEAAAARLGAERLTSRVTEAQALAGQRRLASETAEALADLERQRPTVERLRAVLDDHHRALPALPLVQDAAERATAAAGAADEAQRARDGLPLALRDAGVADLEAERELLVGVAALVRGWGHRERRVLDLRRRRDGLDDEVAALSASVRAAATARASTQDRLAALAEERALLEPVAEAVASATAQVQHHVAALEAARAAVGLREQVRAAVDTQQAVTDEAQRLREEHLALWERRVSGAAGELATRLAAGCSCPVCGSREHPSPAPSAEVVPESEEADVRARAETAETERLVAVESVAALRSHLAAAESLSGGVPVARLTLALDEARAEELRAAEAARRLEAVDRAVAEARDRLELAEVTLAATTTRHDERSETLTRLDADLAQEEAELAELLHAVVPPDVDPGRRGVAAVTAAVQRRGDAVTTALAAVRRADEAAAAHAQAQGASQRAVAAAGFGDAEQCLAAHLDAAEAARHAQQVEVWERARARADHTWSSPGVAAALDLPEPPVAELTARLEEAVAARDAALSAQSAVEQRVVRSTALRAELAERCRAWAPLRERHDTVARLAALTEGTGADNRLRMRLTGYVLAERLRQVVAAANERLAAMTEQRFALEHAEERGAGEQRGGLSLRVRDDWSGTRRDPATLSGGESFQVSLALALGLADTVAHEAGGTVLDTLVVDEGFGALDADSLDAVMDVLDGLRDGGRVVGIVSHVAELRDRIPAQLEVRRGREGSTVGRAVLPG